MLALRFRGTTSTLARTLSSIYLMNHNRFRGTTLARTLSSIIISHES